MLIKLFLNIGERRKAPSEDAVEGSDGGAVISHWNALVGGGATAVSHFLFRQHTAAAMDDELVICHTVGECGAGGELEYGFGTGAFAYPLWELYRSDISALAVVGASLGYEYPVPVFYL